MFLVNVQKCMRLFSRVYVSSDDSYILSLAQEVGAVPISRGESLGGDTPNIPVYQHALGKIGDVGGIVAVQACSPTIKPELIRLAKNLLEQGSQEVMTCHPITRSEDYHGQHFKIYGSIWALSLERLQGYGDPYAPQPDVLLVDESIDIHNEDDYQAALCQ